MSKILIVISFAFFQTTSFAYDWSEEIPKNLIPLGYSLVRPITVDLNGDGLYDNLVVLEEINKAPIAKNANGNQYPVLILTQQQDESLKVLERNAITVSCDDCSFGYTIKSFATPPQISSWVSIADGSRSRVYVPNEIGSFSEKGYRIVYWVSSDLNGDGLDDYLIVIEKQKKEILGPGDAEIGVDSEHRSVLIVIRQPDKTLKLVNRNDIVASCITCYDFYTTNASLQLIASKRSFSIRTQAQGTAFLTTFTYNFAYSRRDNTWQLIRVHENYEAERVHDNSFEKVYMPPKDFGKIDFVDFNPESYRGYGEGYQPPKKKKMK